MSKATIGWILLLIWCVLMISEINSQAINIFDMPPFSYFLKKQTPGTPGTYGGMTGGTTNMQPIVIDSQFGGMHGIGGTYTTNK